MNHAIIFTDDPSIIRIMQPYLSELGFTSFDHVRDRLDLVRAVKRRRPALLVIGTAERLNECADAIGQICTRHAIPAILAMPKLCERPLFKGAMLDGPYRLDELDTALEDASRLAGPAKRGRTFSTVPSPAAAN
jgi:hypothetical protein